MRLQIKYFDQNESFAPLLPREGIVESTPRCSDSELAWHLLRLDSSLEYQGVEYSHFLVSSRWRGHQIGETEAVSVFVLLVPSSEGGVHDGFSHKQYPQAVWGMANVVNP